MSDANARIDAIVNKNDVVLFMKGTALFPQCGFSSRAAADGGSKPPPRAPRGR
jgi:monothiol glutaredoxin